MKYCEKCGKQLLDEAVICPDCETPTGYKPDKTDFSSLTKDTTAFYFLGVAALISGVVLGFFVNPFLGAAVILGAMFLFVAPNTRLKNAVKKEYKYKLNDEELKEKTDEIKTKAKREIPLMKVCTAFACISLVFMIPFVFGLNANSFKSSNPAPSPSSYSQDTQKSAETKKAIETKKAVETQKAAETKSDGKKSTEGKFKADSLIPNTWYTYTDYDVVKVQNYLVSFASGSGDRANVFGSCVCSKCHIVEHDPLCSMCTVTPTVQKTYRYTCPYCGASTTVKIKFEY